MENNDAALIRWMHRRSADLDKATLGQLTVLMELVTSVSVAAMGKMAATDSSASAGVNFRQKLSRLEKALGIGPLTKRVGKFTRPTEAGNRVAGELRLFLSELRAIESQKGDVPAWSLGAGETWLTGLIIPALASLSRNRRNWRWEIQNLRSKEIRDGLREGMLHFGFVRVGDAALDGFTAGTRVKIESYCVVLGEADQAPTDAKSMILWAISQNRPLIQQGSTWRSVCERVGRTLGIVTKLSQVSPHLTCETHPQALSAAAVGPSWCIVPNIPGLIPSSGVRLGVFAAGKDPESMVLLNYSRSLKKHADADVAWEELNRAIRDVANHQ